LPALYWRCFIVFIVQLFEQPVAHVAKRLVQHYCSVAKEDFPPQAHAESDRDTFVSA
jgi:hypothetical protein